MTLTLLAWLLLLLAVVVVLTFLTLGWAVLVMRGSVLRRDEDMGYIPPTPYGRVDTWCLWLYDTAPARLK